MLIGERIKVFQLSMNLGVPGVRLFVTQTAGELFITEAAECQTTKKKCGFPIHVINLKADVIVFHDMSLIIWMCFES